MDLTGIDLLSVSRKGSTQDIDINSKKSDLFQVNDNSKSDFEEIISEFQDNSTGKNLQVDPYILPTNMQDSQVLRTIDSSEVIEQNAADILLANEKLKDVDAVINTAVGFLKAPESNTDYSINDTKYIELNLLNDSGIQAAVINKLSEEGLQSKSLDTNINSLSGQEPELPFQINKDENESLSVAVSNLNESDDQLILDKIKMNSQESSQISQRYNEKIVEDLNKNEFIKHLPASQSKQQMSLESTQTNTRYTTNEVGASQQIFTGDLSERMAITSSSKQNSDIRNLDSISDNKDAINTMNQSMVLNDTRNEYQPMQEISQFSDSTSRIENAAVYKQLQEKIHFMLNNNEQSAKIELDPEELGRIEINLLHKNNQTHVSFVTSLDSTKEIIESRIDGLRNLLHANGLHLGDVNISSDNKNNQTQHYKMPQSQHNPEYVGSDEALSNKIIVSNNQLDLYA